MHHFAFRIGPMLAVAALVVAGPLQRGVAADLRLARFSADVTIPLGHRCMGILPTKATTIVDPLQVHGVVLLGHEQPIVLAAFDWCEIRNDSYDAWRDALAEAVGSTPERVLVCSLHQHDAPVVDGGAQKLLDDVGLEGELFDTAFHNDCVQRVSQAVRDCLATAQPVTHLGVGVARVDRIASNRRLLHLDGRVAFDRYSAGGGNAFQADAPEGLIDPMLKTISFWNGDKALLAINSYAVHPMSYYGRGGVSYDFVGMAREQHRRQTGVPQIYVSGCSGDVVAGKYNDGSTDQRRELAERLRTAMQLAWEATERRPLTQIAFRNVQFQLPFHAGEAFSKAAMLKTLRNENAEVSERILAAMGISSRLRIEAGKAIDMPCIDLGDAQIVLLPGEAFVGYQIMAQQMRPDVLVMPIGYGECWPGYIPTEAAFDDGFNHGWRWAGQGSEAAIKPALRKVLRPTSSPFEQTGKWQQIALPEDVRQRCLEILRDGANSDSFWPSMHAVEALTVVGQADPLKPQLASRLSSETDEQHRCGLARELVRAGEKQYTTLLLETLADEDSAGRTHAAESLYKIGEIGDGVALRAAMEQTEDEGLRRMACAALARQGSTRAMAILRESLRSDDAMAVGISAWVLGYVGDDGVIPLLKEALPAANTPLMEAYVYHAMAALGDAEGRLRLADNLGADDPVIRAAAANTAGQSRITALAQQLIDQLDDDDLDVRIRAAQALLEMEQPLKDPKQQISYLVFEATEANPRYTEGSIVELADGTLLFAVTEFEGSGSDFAKARIIGRETRDGGRTWSEPRVLQENIGDMNVMSVTLRRLGPPNRWDTPIGMFYLVKNSKQSLDVFLRVSEDQAKTFGQPIKLNDRSGYHVMNNDRVLRLSNGRLLAPVAYTDDVEQSNHFVSFCLLSDDQGKTWRRGRGSVDQPQRGAMEPDVVELSDGRVMMIVRTQLGHIAAAHSSDGGDTWGEPFALDVTAPEAPATIGRLPSTGELLLIWNNTFNAGQGHGGRRTPLTAAVSADDGRTWRKVGDLETRTDRTYAYTSLIFAGSRAVLSYWDQDVRSGRFSARFRSLPMTWFQ